MPTPRLPQSLLDRITEIVARFSDDLLSPAHPADVEYPIDQAMYKLVFGDDYLNWEGSDPDATRKAVVNAVKRAQSARGIDPRVTVIRGDREVGRFSCSVIDETYTDAELSAALDEARIRSVGGALRWAHKRHSTWHLTVFGGRA